MICPEQEQAHMTLLIEQELKFVVKKRQKKGEEEGGELR